MALDNSSLSSKSERAKNTFHCFSIYVLLLLLLLLLLLVLLLYILLYYY